MVWGERVSDMEYRVNGTVAGLRFATCSDENGARGFTVAETPGKMLTPTFREG